MRIVALAGGVGAARFLLGVRAAAPEAQAVVVGNTGDDITLHGLRICPDLDTVMYTLGGGIDPGRGWGRAGETWVVRAELTAYAETAGWFGLGDRDLATHLIRTELLAAGHPLSAVTARLCARWRPGVELLPMSDDRVETHVRVSEGGTERELHFQEWWVRLGARPPVLAVTPVGAPAARPAPGVLAAIAAADVVLLPPSNPVVSIGPILAVPGIGDALRATPAPVVGVAPIVAGAPVRGMADKLLPVLGVPVTAEGVGRHYGARADGGLLDGWLVHTTDAAATVPGVPTRAVPLLMTDLAATTAIARAALGLAGR